MFPFQGKKRSDEVTKWRKFVPYGRRKIGKANYMQIFCVTEKDWRVADNKSRRQNTGQKSSILS
jgi:hypothetical protein